MPLSNAYIIKYVHVCVTLCVCFFYSDKCPGGIAILES